MKINIVMGGLKYNYFTFECAKCNTKLESDETTLRHPSFEDIGFWITKKRPINCEFVGKKCLNPLLNVEAKEV